MARDSTKVLWRVQVRKSRAHKWVSKGTFETRESARARCEYLRDGIPLSYSQYGHGFGNTRVLRVEKAR